MTAFATDDTILRALNLLRWEHELAPSELSFAAPGPARRCAERLEAAAARPERAVSRHLDGIRCARGGGLMLVPVTCAATGERGGPALSHWVLYAASGRRRAILFFDPFGSPPSTWGDDVARVGRALGALLAGFEPAAPLGIRAQTDGRSCGYHVLWACRALALDHVGAVPLSESVAEVERARAAGLLAERERALAAETRARVDAAVERFPRGVLDWDQDRSHGGAELLAPDRAWRRDSDAAPLWAEADRGVGDGVLVGPSELPGSGLGLFAGRRFRAGEVVTSYACERLVSTSDESGRGSSCRHAIAAGSVAPGFVFVDDATAERVREAMGPPPWPPERRVGSFADGRPLRDVACMANSARYAGAESPRREPNVAADRFGRIDRPDRPRGVLLVATRGIEPGEEILADYRRA